MVRTPSILTMDSISNLVAVTAAVSDVDKENILPQDKISIDNKDESKR